MITTLQGTVDPKWIDSNGHVNIEIYTKLLDLSLENFIGIPDSIKSFLPENTSCVVTRMFTVHRSEIRFPASWLIRAGIFEIDQKGFKSLHQIESAGRQVTKFYVQCKYFDLETRKSKIIDSDLISKFDFPQIKGIRDPLNII